MLLGQVSVQAVTGLTVTLKLQGAVWGGSEKSVAMQLTVVVPTGKVLPEAGLQVTCTQLPVAVGAG